MQWFTCHLYFVHHKHSVHVQESYSGLLVCMSVCLFVLTLVPAYDVRATNCSRFSAELQRDRYIQWSLQL